MSSRSTQQPNVVVFFTDQQRWDCSGLHGNPLGLMPNFDRLATSGTHLPLSFSCQPVCAPVRSTLQVGRFATATGVWRNGMSIDTSLPSMAQTFKNAGYTTGYIGKWHLYDSPADAPGPVPAEYRTGYDYWLASNLLEFTSDAYQTTLFDDENRPVDLHGYRVDACTDAANAFLRSTAHGEAPFYLFLSLVEPHHQNHRDDYPAPEGYAERYMGRWMPPDLQALGGSAYAHLPGYYGMVKRIDEALGRLMDHLRSLGILENTIVLFTSDHGSHFKTRNGEYKRSLHESAIRVPTMVTGGPFTGGGRMDHLVSHVDLPATLLDACGIAVPDTFHGRSVLPLLHGDAAGTEPWRDEVFVQISESQIGRAIRTHRWKYGVTAPGSATDGSGWREPWAPRMEETFLYDLASDPYELKNLVTLGSHREVRAHLRHRLLARMEEAGEQPAEIVPSPDEDPRSGGQRRVLEHEVLQ